MTQKEKLASFDAVAQERDALRLALYDLENGKFSPAVTMLDETKGTLSVQRSERAMPLYLTTYWRGRGESRTKSVDVLTETAIEAMRGDSGFNALIVQAADQLRDAAYRK